MYAAQTKHTLKCIKIQILLLILNENIEYYRNHNVQQKAIILLPLKDQAVHFLCLRYI